MAKKAKCIEWPGNRDRDGYGFVKIDGVQRRAHRVALEQHLGRKLASHEWVLHSCDRPACVNPAHLRIGNAAENNRQARAKKQTLAQRLLGVP